MTHVTQDASMDIAQRFLNDPTGNELRSTLAHLSDLQFHLESSLRRPSSPQVHQVNQVSLQAVLAALETLKTVARLWMARHRPASTTQ